MTIETRRCPECGNPIPVWAGGACPVCARNKQDEKRYGRRSRRRRRPPPAQDKASHRPPIGRTKRQKIEPAGSPQAKKPGAARKRLERGSRGWRRLGGFNRLLIDVYGRPTRLSRLLTKQGASPAQIERWREDGPWLVRFMRRLERKLLNALAEAMPGQDPRVLSLRYGLDGKGNRSIETIAAKLGMMTVAALVVHKRQLTYLQSKPGRTELERAVLLAARETADQ